MTLNSFGSGRCWTCGSAFTEETVLYILDREDIHSVLCGRAEIPWSVEAAVRGDVLFLLNYLDTDAVIKTEDAFTDLLTGEEKQGTFTIPAFGAAALRIK